jgi:hypothetical protein
MVASAGETNRDLAATQITKNCVIEFKHYKFKLYNVYNVYNVF